MLSIIICTKHARLNTRLTDNIRETVGVPYEIVAINNYRNAYSIFSAYNQGVRETRFPNLCFVHEDVLFHTQNWGRHLVLHLENEQTGIIGVAGGNFACKVPSLWTASRAGVNLIQSDHTGKRASKHHRTPKGEGIEPQEVILLDGVFLAMRKALLNGIRFDDNLFHGFHLYDADICMQAAVKGFKNYVVYDILLEHFSYGSRDTYWIEASILFQQKWGSVLPQATADADISIIRKTERKELYRFMKFMIKAGYSVPATMHNLKVIFALNPSLRGITSYYFKTFWYKFLRSFSGK